MTRPETINCIANMGMKALVDGEWAQAEACMAAKYALEHMLPVSADEEFEFRRLYGKLDLSPEEHDIIWDCYLRSVNRDGHAWVTWSDIEWLLVNLKGIDRTQEKEIE